MKIFSCLMVLLIIFILGCEKMEVPNRCRQKVEELTAASKIELQAGSSDMLIKSFLERHKINYSYDRFNNRYQGIIRKIDGDRKFKENICDVVVYINLNDDKSYLSSEFLESYTGM